MKQASTLWRLSMYWLGFSIGVLAVPPRVGAQEGTWSQTGAHSSNDWGTAENWSPLGVPASVAWLTNSVSNTYTAQVNDAQAVTTLNLWNQNLTVGAGAWVALSSGATLNVATLQLARNAGLRLDNNATLTTAGAVNIGYNNNGTPLFGISASANTVTVTSASSPGGVWNFSGQSLVHGFVVANGTVQTSLRNALSIGGGVKLTNLATMVVGGATNANTAVNASVTAASNQVVIAGAGTTVNVAGEVTVGLAAALSTSAARTATSSWNRVVVEAGATLVAPTLSVGKVVNGNLATEPQPVAQANALVVNDATVSANIIVGTTAGRLTTGAAGNLLFVTNGTLRGGLTLGEKGSDGNVGSVHQGSWDGAGQALLVGFGNVGYPSDNLTRSAGGSSDNNQLTFSGGIYTNFGLMVVGSNSLYNVTSGNNRVTVRGTGTLLAVSNVVVGAHTTSYPGGGGNYAIEQDNVILVQDGAGLDSSSAVIGYQGTQSGSAHGTSRVNRVELRNATWTNTGNIIIGQVGSGSTQLAARENSLLVSNSVFHNGGTLTVGLGTGALNNKFWVTGNSTATVQKLLVTSGNLLQVDGGTLRVSGSLSNYSAANLVIGDGQQETLLQLLDPAQPAFFAGGLTITNNAALGGSGRIASTVTIKQGGRLEPGNSVGTLTTTNLTLQAGAIYVWELDANGGDLIQVNGAVIATSGSYTLRLVNLGGNPVGNVYTLLQATDLANSLFDASLWTLDFGTSGYSDGNGALPNLSWNAGNGQLQLSGLEVIPEPSALLMVGLGLAGLWAWGRGRLRHL